MEAAYAEAQQQQQCGCPSVIGNDMAAEYMGQAPEEEQLEAAWGEAGGAEATGEDYIQEMLRAEGHQHGEAQRAEGDTWAEEYHDDFADEYLNGGADLDTADDWLNEYREMTQRIEAAQNSTDYPFEPNNAFLFHDRPLEEGAELLASGMLSDAVLAFEAACQKDGDNIEAWRLLGTTQAENEKDALAILALNKARMLSPTDLSVLMALSVSHTNEANQTSALAALRSWILANDRFPGLAEAVAAHTADPALHMDEGEAMGGEYLFQTATECREVESLFSAAAEMAAGDADVHIGLGILHNLSRSYDQAADNFGAALRLRPDDEKLWNKLGATLANGNRSDEAIGAYNRALDIKPGFVRAQYNLGIAQSNLGDHRSAARQFIRAVVMQQGGVVMGDGGGDAAQRSTREMWDVLRMTFNLMDRPDLVELAWKQSVAPFLSEFGLEELMV